MVRYHNFDIVFAEIPGETTLAFNITGCPNRCPGCHSPHLQTDEGCVLDDAELLALLACYGRSVTCVAFMGGDAEPHKIARLAKTVRKTYPVLHTAWYSGREELPEGFESAAFDYVIKRYFSECYALKDDPKSKYYGTKSGKPAVIILCTDWHDARTTYNAAIRRLAARWGLPLVEFDTNVGFSKDAPNPATGTQQSLLHAQDTQTIEGVTYGWHPQRGEDKYIQQRMAAIFSDTMRRILPAK